jgi:hypothetical protein
MRTTTGSAGRAAVALSVAVALILAPLAIGSASAQQASATEQARQHFNRGKQLFASGEYRGAIAEFAAADKLAASPLLEFNIALCHERLGERAEAVRRFRLYLERVPDAANRGAVEDKIARLEAELKAEAEASRGTAPPAGGVVGPPPSIGGSTAPPAPPDGAAPAEGADPPASTGDPDLDRAAKIDIGRLRDQRRAAGAPPPPSRAATAPPDSAGPGGPPPVRSDGGEKKSKPIYKEWWFWVAAVGGTLILVAIATGGSDSSDGRSRILPLGDMPRDMAQPGGAVLLRF